MTYRLIPFFLALSTVSALAGDAVPHVGLLSNLEMAQVNHNAQNTQKLLFPEQQISACFPYDTGAKTAALTGVAYCKVETAHMLNNSLHNLRGPDIYCSYLHEEFCDVKASK